MLQRDYYFSAFEPFDYQREVLDLLYNYDYVNKYWPSILLSGSVGSAKSALGAHWLISHCLRWRKARTFICRMGLPDLKKTIFHECVEALQNDPSFKEGVHFKAKYNSAQITFANGSEILPITFGDRNWGKVKSYLFSGGLVEEATEMEDDFYKDEHSGFDMLMGRINRLAHVRENFLLMLTNPDEPDHFLYDYFIEGHKKFDDRYVFYSQTDKNPYLDPNYIEKLRASYSPLMAERYLRGRWISISGKGIYAAYDPNVNKSEEIYKVRSDLPVRISFDFNIALNKPMSCVLFQYDPIKDHVHFFNESVIHGSYTQDIMEDLDERGLLDFSHIIIHGDATGKARNPGSKLGNYDVIRTFLEQKQVAFEMKVPRANPPIRTRHTKMNAYCKNDLGQVRLTIYKQAKTAHMGMLLTKLKKGTNYIEDDSKPEQHITTAMGYGLISAVRSHNRRSNVSKK